jgi:serine/threonine-protein kinase RsbW
MMPQQGPRVRASLRIENRLDEIERLHLFWGGFADRAGLTPEVRFKVELALEEAVANVVRHGFTDGRAHEIAVRLELRGRTIRVRLEDDGRPFNPLEAPPVDPDQPLDQRPVGGLGIHLIRSLMDGVSYRRTAGRNVLSLTKAANRKE